MNANAPSFWLSREIVQTIRTLAVAAILLTPNLLRAQPVAPAWINRYNGPAHGTDKALSTAVDSGTSRVYVTGSSSYASAVVAYSTAGDVLWTNYFNSPGDGGATVAVATDGNGKVFVTGYVPGTNGPSEKDFQTVACSSTGTPLWTNRYNGPVNGDDAGTGIGLDTSGNIYVAGYSMGAGTGFDYLSLKYSMSGGSPIPLDFQIVGGRLKLSWANAAFHLQSAPLVNGAFTNVLNATNPYTINFSEPQQYFRLKSP